ncbi:hypothetical protein ACIOD0_22000 [Kitasatospora albolonga]
MEAELTALAASGATALVGLMATEAWNQVRGRAVRFLARNDEESAAVDAELEESRAELIGLRAGADEDSAADAEEEWRLRLRRALRTNPEAAAELRDLLMAGHALPDSSSRSGTTPDSRSPGARESGTCFWKPMPWGRTSTEQWPSGTSMFSLAVRI